LEKKGVRHIKKEAKKRKEKGIVLIFTLYRPWYSVVILIPAIPTIGIKALPN
jgi:hypothetical protein